MLACAVRIVTACVTPLQTPWTAGDAGVVLRLHVWRVFALAAAHSWRIKTRWLAPGPDTEPVTDLRAGTRLSIHTGQRTHLPGLDPDVARADRRWVALVQLVPSFGIPGVRHGLSVFLLIVAAVLAVLSVRRWQQVQDRDAPGRRSAPESATDGAGNRDTDRDGADVDPGDRLAESGDSPDAPTQPTRSRVCRPNGPGCRGSAPRSASWPSPGC